MSRTLYTPMNWYWNVGDSNAQVFSSNALGFVSLTDATYNNWLALGNVATSIPNGDLYDVIAQQVIPGIMANGVQLNSTGTPSLDSVYPLDANSVSNMQGILTQIALGMGLPGGGSTFMFNGVSMTSAQFQAVSIALSNYMYDFNLQLGTIIASNGEAGTLPGSTVTIA